MTSKDCSGQSEDITGMGDYLVDMIGCTGPTGEGNEGDWR